MFIVVAYLMYILHVSSISFVMCYNGCCERNKLCMKRKDLK